MNDKLMYYNFSNLREYYKTLGIDIPDQYLRWVQALINTKLGMFQYTNLPDNLTSTQLEMALMFNNFLCWYKSDALGLVLCRYVPSAEYDLYWRPVKVELRSLSGKTIAYNVPFEDIVLCKDNTLDTIPFLTLNGYIREIVEMENTMHILVKLIRFPSVVTGDKEQVAQLKKLLQANAECKGFVIGDKSMANTLQMQNIQLPSTPMEMFELMEKYKNMATQSIGIYSVEEKRERFASGEIATKNDYTDFVYNNMLQCRKDFTKGIKDKWGITIDLTETYDTNKIEEAELEAKSQAMLPQYDMGNQNNVTTQEAQHDVKSVKYGLR